MKIIIDFRKRNSAAQYGFKVNKNKIEIPRKKQIVSREIERGKDNNRNT